MCIDRPVRVMKFSNPGVSNELINVRAYYLLLHIPPLEYQLSAGSRRRLVLLAEQVLFVMLNNLSFPTLLGGFAR